MKNTTSILDTIISATIFVGALVGFTYIISMLVGSLIIGFVEGGIKDKTSHQEWNDTMGYDLSYDLYLRIKNSGNLPVVPLNKLDNTIQPHE